VAKIVALASPKGGTGKSMLTALIGSETAAQGRRVLMIDADPQATLMLWKSQCEANEVELTNMEFEHLVDPAELGVRLRRHSDHDLILIDNQGAANERMTVAARNADLVLIPSRPIMTELVEASRLVELLAAWKGRGPDTPVRVVINAFEVFDRNSIAMKTALEFIRQTRLPVTDILLKQRVYYKNAISGSTLWALKGDKKAIMDARYNIIDLIEEVGRLTGAALLAEAA